MTAGPLPGGDPIPLTVVRLAVGLAFGTVGILLELGLDQVVVVAPWLVVGFGTGLAAAVLGGFLGGGIAAAIGVAGGTIAIPAWVPAVDRLEGAGWPFQLATALAALAVGLAIRRLILSDWPLPGATDRARDRARQGAAWPADPRPPCRRPRPRPISRSSPARSATSGPSGPLSRWRMPCHGTRRR